MHQRSRDGDLPFHPLREFPDLLPIRLEREPREEVVAPGPYGRLRHTVYLAEEREVGIRGHRLVEP
ncbi:hypothetical protein DSECCO2_644760 [anaerobic digester metagenome]